MQVSVESGEGLERRMTVELPAEIVNGALEKRLKEIARRAKIAGFRPGKVPLSVIRQRYTEQARQEIFGDLVQSTYFEALAKEKLQPAGELQHRTAGSSAGRRYRLCCRIRSDAGSEIAGYVGKVITRPQVEVTESDLNAMLEKLQSSAPPGTRFRGGQDRRPGNH